jgi:hypothetical protein
VTAPSWIPFVSLLIAGASLLISAASLGIALRALLRGPDIRLRLPVAARSVRDAYSWRSGGLLDTWQYDCHVLIANTGGRTGVLEQFPSEPVAIEWLGQPPSSFCVHELMPTLHDATGEVSLPLVVEAGEIRRASFRLPLGFLDVRNVTKARDRLAKELSSLKGFRVRYTYAVSTKRGIKRHEASTEISFAQIKARAIQEWRDQNYQRAIDILEGRDPGRDV